MIAPVPTQVPDPIPRDRMYRLLDFLSPIVVFCAFAIPLPLTAQTCAPGAADCAELRFGVSSYETQVSADDVLRSDISAYGIESPEFPTQLALVTGRHRLGEVLIEPGFALRKVSEDPAGDYRPQLTTLLAGVTDQIESVIESGGSVQLNINCATPEWLATHAYPHNIISGIDEPSGQPVWACSAPRDLDVWRQIMRALGEQLGSLGDKMTITIGNEPENYFVGTQDQLLAWYTASVLGILDSTSGFDYRFGGITIAYHKTSELTKTNVVPESDGSVSFTRTDYEKPVLETWLAHSAMNGLPLNVVTLHQFGGSPVPSAGTFWRHARRDISTWLTSSGYDPANVDVVINDFPQWAPFASNDTEYYAAHVASGIISMLDLSLREGETIRPLQGYLSDYGFRPDGVFSAGFTGVPGFVNEKWLIEPVYNLNSLLAELHGTVMPVSSTDPFVHAVAVEDRNETAILVVHQVPLEYQIDLKFEFWEEFPILINYFVSEDVSSIEYDLGELIGLFFNGVKPSWEEMFDALFSDPSPIDVDVLSWPDEIKKQWRELQKIGQMARKKRAGSTTVLLHFDGLPGGTYRYEHYVLDSQHANTYRDREILQARLDSAMVLGNGALVEEISSINQEYDAESAKVSDQTIELTGQGAPIAIEVEPNSIHLVRMSASSN